MKRAKKIAVIVLVFMLKRFGSLEVLKGIDLIA